MKFSKKPIKVTLLQLIYFCLFGIAFVFLLYSVFTHDSDTVSGICFWISILLMLYLSRPGSDLHKAMQENAYEKILILLVAALTIFYCVTPMGMLPLWNGEDPGHRNQYELLAESFLEGKLYIEYGDEEDLLLLNNPYDPEERRESGVRYHWDHAYFNGRYYVYFGAVPVLLTFLPYRILTGTALTTYHATQIFTAGIIIAFFCLFYLLRRLFFPKLSFGIYLFSSVAFSMISVWYASSSPALYATAITAGICLEMWSIFFFCKGVWDCQEERSQLGYAFLGALLGALVFGCRPPIGLANLVVLPLLYAFLKQHRITPKLLGKLCLAALPYLIVALLLMGYNYARFCNPFEFGQSYQLTVADQRELNRDLLLVDVINETIKNLFYYFPMKEEFPHAPHNGVFFNFPIFLWIFTVIIPEVRKQLRDKKLQGFALELAAAILVITVMDIIGSPHLMERYRMDIYFLASILCYLMIGAWHASLEEHRQKRSVIVMHMSVVMIVFVVFRYLYEVSINYPEFVQDLESVVCFWRFL